MKHLKLFFVLFAMLALNVGNAWGETATLSNANIAAKYSSSQTSYRSITGITDDSGHSYSAYAILNQHSKATSTYKFLQIRKYASNTAYYVQVPPMPGNITSISMTVSSTSQSMTGGGNSSTLYFSSSNKTSSTGTGVASGTGAKSVTIDCSSLKLKEGFITAGGAVRIWDITITYETSGSGEPTATLVSIAANAEDKNEFIEGDEFVKATITATYDDETTKDVTSLATFSAPNMTQIGEQTVSVSYTEGEVTAETSYTINITEKPKYTVTWKVNGEDYTTTQVAEGNKPTFPTTPESCDATSTTFYGWATEAWSGKLNDISDKTIYTSANAMPAETATYHAVFCEGSGSTTLINETFDDSSTTDSNQEIATTFSNFAGESSKAFKSQYGGVKFGNSSTAGYITSKSLDLSSPFTVTLDACKFGSDAGNIEVTVGAETKTINNSSLGAAGTFNTYTLEFDAATATSTVKIATSQKRAYIDNVVIATKGAATNFVTTCAAAPEPAVLVSIAANAEDKNEFTEGDAFVKAIITATYDDATTKDVTEEATFTGYDMSTPGEQTVTVTYTENEVTKTATYNITVNAKPKYTITWNNAGTTNTTEIVQGAALGELPTVTDCSSGKKFMGWTAATEVNNDGSGIVYVKETDIPTSDMTYYAVFAVVTSTGEPVTSYKKVTTISDGTYLIAATNVSSSYAYTGQVTGKDFGGYIGVTIENDEITTKPVEAAEITVKVTDGKFSMHDGSKYLYLSSSDNELHYNDAEQIVWALDADGKINITTYGTRYLRFNAQSGNERFACYSSAQKDAFLYKKVTTTSETVSDYSLDCSITVEPTWTISKDAIDFADKYVGVSYTETFTISASNLTDDIALAIDGSNFTVSPTSIATDAEFPQTVTVTYAPTAAGSHNATLNITSGSTLSKAIALTGSATEATIYTLTALADIKPTDKVIIVGTSGGSTYAMSNDKGTGKAPAAVEVTVADNKIATNETNILWNIAKNGDNLTIYPADQTAKWLYCLANENNGVRVGSNTNKIFILDATSGYLQHTGTLRYLGIYNNQDWRCYTSYTTDNIKDQSFAFYVLPNTDPSISVTPASKDFGVLTVGETVTQEIEITALNITKALTAEITGDGFTKSEIVDNKITITFAPTEVKEYSATLTISAGTEASVSVTLEGEGVAATYSVTYDKNGAEGDAPTDETKYVADSKVTVAGQGDMTKAGYRFAGWKYGENIYKEGAKFNMPAEDVTFVAQWVEKQKFDAGYWVLVTDASELNADDYVVIAAADYDVAMKSYETGNNCKQVEVTKVNNLLTWNENVGVFQLDKSGENYTFQDVNTEQYLYAAGGTSNNYLRAADAIPTDENAKKYTWTISVADNKATIKAQIEDNGENKARNTIMYNATEGVNGQLFSCYASGQKDIALYKYQTTYAYTRTVTNGNYGTICLPYASSNYTGMELYEVSWLKEGTGLYLDQLAAGAQLVAGKPYIFRATSTEIEVICTGDAVATPIAGENGLTGTFTDIAANTDLVGHYIIAQNKIWQANDQNTLPANRAYINATLVPTSEQPKLAGRRRVCMGENAATGLDNITNGENTTIKVIENGQLVIIRNGEKFNAQGVRF